MNRYDKILSLCTDSNSKMLDKPLLENELVYAADGFKCVQLAAHLPEENANYKKSPYDITQVYSKILQRHGLINPLWFTPEDLQSALAECKRKLDYKQKKCSNINCENGIVVCDSCRHEAECEVCGGCGTIPDEDAGRIMVLSHPQTIKINETPYAAADLETLNEIARLAACYAIVILAHNQGQQTLFKVCEAAVLMPIMPLASVKEVAAEIQAVEDDKDKRSRSQTGCVHTELIGTHAEK